MNRKYTTTFKIMLLGLHLLSSNNIGYAGTVTVNMPVSANVVPGCTISASTLAFGSAYTGAAVLNGTATVSYQCANGSTATIGAGNGLNYVSPARRMVRTTTPLDYINYYLYVDSNRTQAWGTTASSSSYLFNVTGTGSAATITVYGQIPASQNVNIGNYTDTVVMTITF